VIPDGGNSSVRYLLPPAGGKFKEVIRPSSRSGSIRISCYLQYKLVTFDSKADLFPITVREEGAYSFGCEWPYSFEQGQLSFGPYQTFVQPRSKDGRILQGSCEQIQSKDQTGGTAAWVYTVLQLNLQPIAGVSSSWTLQAPIVGGPSYTDQSQPTSGNNFALGGYWLECAVPGPITITGLLDPALPLQVMLTFANEKDTDFVKNELGELFKWIDQIKDSNLLPVIQKRYLRMYLRSHASKTGDATMNRIYSDKRAARLKWYLDQEFGASIEVISDPRGDKDARPLTGIKPKDYNRALRDDRNVTLFIEAGEATAALVRDQKVMAQP
jgi:hypothetical protein